MKNDHDDDAFLQGFFAEARERAEAEPVPAALMARVLQSAADLQPAPAWSVPVAAPPGRGTRLRQALSGLFQRRGGYGAQLAGIALAAMVGVSLGWLQPVSLGQAGDLDAALIETLELLPEGPEFWTDGLGLDLVTDETND